MTVPQLIGGATLLGAGEHQRDVEALHPDVMDQHHFIDAMSGHFSNSGTLGGAPQYNGAWLFDQLMWTTTQSATIGVNVDVAGGTYTIDWYTAKRSDMPNIQARVGTVAVGALTDLYVANFNVNPFLYRTTGVAIARGKKFFDIVCPSKNASSSGYVMVVSALAITRTGP